MFGVGFIPSKSQKNKAWITDIDAFIINMDDPREVLGDKEYIKDSWNTLGGNFLHEVAPFLEIDESAIYADSLDCRSKVFETPDEATKHIKTVINDYRLAAFPPKGKVPAFYDFTFDDGVVLE